MCSRVPNIMALNFTSKEDERLVEAVKNRPALYDMESEHHRRGILKDELWDSVAATVKRSVADCKKRWRIVRDNYLKNKKRQKMGLSSPRHPSWPLYYRLTFMDNVKPRKRSNGMQPNIIECVTISNDYPADQFIVPNGMEETVEDSDPVSSPTASSSQAAFRRIAPKIENVDSVFRRRRISAGKMNLQRNACRKIAPKTKLAKSREMLSDISALRVMSESQTDIRKSKTALSSVEQFESHGIPVTIDEQPTIKQEHDIPVSMAVIEDDIIAVEETNGGFIITDDFQDNSCHKTDTKEIEEDDVDLFMKSIALSVKKLPPMLISKAKLQILSLVTELECSYTG